MNRQAMVKSILTIGTLVWIAAFMGGCAAPAVIQSDAPAARAEVRPHQAPVQATPAVYRSEARANGSLWAEGGGGLSEMFINAKARRVGDIVTIKIVESSKASNKASTKTGRTSNMDVGIGSLFNLENSWNSPGAVFNPFSGVSTTYDNEFDGSGSTARSNDLNAYITARILQVMSNGNLLIEGNREVRVNHENQIITLTGIVRPRDISSQNVILSTYIADARISYSGSGIINDKQRPGWLVRLIDNIWPF